MCREQWLCSGEEEAPGRRRTPRLRMSCAIPRRSARWLSDGAAEALRLFGISGIRGRQEPAALSCRVTAGQVARATARRRQCLSG